MAIYFSNTLSKEPFQFDSVGNHWLQEALSRPQGYPIYHYLQTEEGCGIFTIDGKEYFLPEGHGILITPHVPHAYRAADTSAWITCFATFGGTMEAHLPQILGNNRIIFTEKENALEIKAVIDRAVARFKTAPVNTHQLSCDCYALLLQFPMDFPRQHQRSCVGKIRPARASADRNTLHGGSDRRTALPQRLCIPPVFVSPVCALSWVLGL